MLKRIISLVMAVVMTVGMLPLQAMAQEIPVEETVVPVESFAETEATAAETEPAETTQETTVAAEPESEETEALEVFEETPSEEAAMSESQGFSYTVLNGTYCQITGYTGSDTEITIPSELDGYIVQSIAGSTFRENTDLTAVVFPESIETIGTYVFSGCTALTEVHLNDGLTNIADYSFQGCTSLTTVTLADTLTTIGRNAFENCTALVSIVLPDSVTSIGFEAFVNCSALSSINYPAGWKTAASRSSSYSGVSYQGRIFAGCKSLTKIEIPEGVTSIPSCAFCECPYLEEAVLPGTLTGIGAYAFYGCSGLPTISLNEGLTSIGSYAFQKCTGLASITLPESLTTLNSYAFAGCTGLTEMEIPGSIAAISSYLFEGCTGLASVTVNEGTTTINGYAFRNCSALTDVTLAEGLTEIKEYAFQNCTGLTAIRLPKGLTTIGRNVFEGCSSLVSAELPDSVTSIGFEAFLNCSKLSSVNYPANWKTAASRSSSYSGLSYQGRIFAGCTSLKKIVIPEGVTSIPGFAFCDSSYLEEVVLPGTLTTIGTYAFYGCSRLATITPNEGLITIGSNAFQNCTGLKTITLPESLTALNSYAFIGCTGLTGIELPGSVMTIASYAFDGCTGMKRLTVNEGTTTINEYAFRNCTGLTEVTLAEDLTTIGRSAFEGCTSLLSVVLPDSVTSIGYEAFLNCTKLSSVNYPVSWKTAASRSGSYSGTGYQGRIFAGCANLKKMLVPEGVTAIPACAFNGCSYLQEVVLPVTLTTIGSNAFYDCTGLEKIWVDQNASTVGGGAFANCSKLTIHGIEGSYAEEYAAANSIPFSTEVMVYKTGTIAGQVTDADGNGVAGVAVAFYDKDKGNLQATVLTDETGAWSYAEAYVGHTYRISFYHGDYTISEATREYLIDAETITAETVIASAKTSIDETDASNFTYTVLNGTYCQITGYTGEAAAISIPSEIDGYIVQSIAGSAFKGNTALTAVAFPETIETIGTYVFSGCTSLTDVRLNSGLSTISDYTFSGCTALESITLPAAVTKIGRNAFENCTALTGIVLPDAVSSIGYEAFLNCSALSSVNYPADWKTAASRSGSYSGLSYQGRIFAGCKNLTKIEIPEGVTTIPAYAFCECPYLEEVVLPGTLTTIGSYAFYGCSKLTTITPNEGLTTIGAHAFRNCTGLKTITLPGSLTALNSYAFAGCTGLTAIEIPGSVAAITSYLFDGCTALKSVTVNEGPATINEYAFRNCTALTEINLSEGLTTIGRNAFEGCTALVSAALPDSVTSIGYEAFLNCSGLSSINYPAGWKTAASRSGSYSGLSYQGRIFAGCKSLKKIEIPEGVTSIPAYAFCECSDLEEVVLPSTLTTIGTYAFYGCSGLNTIVPNEGLTTIGGHAFRNCTDLKTITLPETLTTLNSYAFAGCTGLTGMEIPGSVATIASYTFDGCTGMKRVTMNEGTTAISEYAFQNCTGLTEVTLAEGLTTIGRSAFEGCSSLVSVVLPDSITSIGYEAFLNCTKLSKINYPASWKTAASRSGSYSGTGYQGRIFAGCSSLKKILVPEGVTTIPSCAFNGCTYLQEVVLPTTLTTIGSNAFYDCTGLEKIWVDQNVSTVGGGAFTNCSKLTIHGIEGTYVEEYAAANSIPFSTEVMVYKTGTIEGRVTDAEGNGVAGVAVAFYDKDKGNLQATVLTDETGAWSYAEAYVGHTYRISFYHADYEISEATQEYLIGEDAITADTVTASARSGIEETDASAFAYKELNGTYCQITGYTGEATEVRIPSELDGHIVQSIAGNAFKGNTALTAVAFPETIETIGTYVFSGCTSLRDVRMNSGLTNIGDYTFSGCTALTTITLPATVTKIGRNAFEGCTSLASAVLPDTVSSIGYEAFLNCSALSSVNYPADWKTAASRSGSYSGLSYQGRIFAGCKNLTKIEIPEGVTTIPAYAFCECPYLEEVVLPGTLTTIGSYAFYGCSRLTTIVPNEGLKTIGTHAFRNCTSLKAITLPETLTALNSYAFSGCVSLNDMEIPGSVATIGSYAFEGCTALKRVTVNEGTTTINDYAFRNCASLTELTLAEGLTTLKEYAFQNCTGLTALTLPEGMTTIERNAFEGCSSLVSVKLPDSVTSIGYEAFLNCSKLSSINYPAGWKTAASRSSNYSGLGYQGRIFAGCTSLKKIEIPEGVTTIPAYAFCECTYLEEVVLPSTLTTIGTYAFYGCSKLTTITPNEGLTTIGAHAFRNCTGLKTITLPESLTALNSYAFAGCTGLAAIEIPGSITAIASLTFTGCTGLKSVTVKEGTTTINEYAFQNCAGLTELTLPEGLTTIGRNVFEGCTSLISAVLPDSVTSIGYEAFLNCSKLSSINYPASWKTAASCSGSYSGLGYQGRIFAGCKSLTKIEIPEGVTTIPSYAFCDCTYLEEVVLPSTLTAIGTYAFYNCTALTTVNLVEGLTAIPAYGFYNCTSLPQVVLPSTVETVGNYAYYNCIGLRSITMNEGLKTIGTSAFYGCDGVLSLVLNEGLQTISNSAFSNCVNLKAVEIPSGVTTIGTNVFDGCSKLTIYCWSGTQAHMVGESEGYQIFLLDEHDHEFATNVETEPTCTRGGSQILTCDICGYYYVDILDALGHDYTDTVVPPACVAEGYTEHDCARCDHSYRDAYVPALGHDYGEWETVTEVTCTVNGSQKRVCKVCAAEDTQVLAAPGHAYEHVVLPPTCTAKGCTVHTCSVCAHAYADNYVDALAHTFGEWEVTKEATILECGISSRFCSVCSAEETEEIPKIVVDIAENPQYGLANFTVLDALSLEPVSGASIFITTDNDGEATIVTDENGRVSQVLPVGQWPVAVYADGYLVRNVDITIEAGEQDIPPIGISDKPLVDATITTREMTYEEMIAAGIDVTSSDNKHYYEYKVEIRFHETIDILTFISYGDGEGNIIHTTSPGNTSRTVYALSHEGSAVAAEAVTIYYTEKYGQYIPDRSTYTNAVWTPELGETIAFENGGYYFEGYGIPSALSMTTDRVFPEDGWTYSENSGRLSMSVGQRTHYLTYMDGEFCTVSGSEDSIPIKLYEQVPGDGYPAGTEYVYIPAETVEDGKQYLLVQMTAKSKNDREALSHDADQLDHETATIHADDVLGDYIVDSALFENAVWLSSQASADGLKIFNNHYFAQVEESILQCMPLANETGWEYNGTYLYTKIGDKTFYLRYANGGYVVTEQKSLAGKAMLFEKTTATDVISGSGQTETKTIYQRVETFEAGKEYIIIGSARNPGGGGGGGGFGGGGGGGGGFGGVLGDGTIVTVYPVSEQFYLIIYGEVSWLKEMFDVEMLILNNSSTDTIENCVAELILPEGLSLATMVGEQQSRVQTVEHIPENGSHSLHWYVRGDREGNYNISATLSGTMMPFGDDFYYEYEADSAIKVYAGEAMQLTFHIPDAAYKTTDYIVTIELENVSHKVLYGVNHMITGWEQGKITRYSDGKEVKEVYGSGGFMGSKGVDAFYPGDKIVIQLSFEILFESSIIKNLMGAVDQAEGLHESYEAIKTAMDLLDGLTGFCKSASGALDGIVKAGKITSKEKLKAANALLNAVNKLYSKFEKGDSEAIKLANNLQSTGAYKTIKSCAEEIGWDGFIVAETAENIMELANKIMCSIGSSESDEKPYNAFDSMRTMVSNIPIRFVVDSVMVTAIGKTTTVIPHTIKMVPVTSPYMGVDNWGKYLYNLMITAMGKIESPWWAQIFGAPDDLTGYEDAVAYVKQVESQIAAYSVHKSSHAQFEAWIERASAANAGIAMASSGTADDFFLIETANETAVYENGKLTFTGNAILEVTALTTEDGILYIKDDEGNVKTVVIDVVEAHTCYSDTWHVELAPTDEHDGYRAKYCDLCEDVIGVETISLCSGHTFGDWIVEQEATTETMGIRYRECGNCGARETDHIPVLEEVFRIPEDAQMSVSEQYVALQTGQTIRLTAEASFRRFEENLTWYIEDGGEEVVTVDAEGNITALAAGTAYIIASVTDGERTLTDRCRIDVADPIRVEGIQLGTTKVTTELYSTDYAQFDVLLKLPQNYASDSVAAAVPEDLGVAITEAKFTDEAMAELFDLVTLDDRTVAVVPTEKALADGKAVQGKYIGTVTVTVQGEDYTSEAMTLTVKKTLPKLKATIDSFNNFYSFQSKEIQVTGATVIGISCENLPDWLRLYAGELSLTDKVPAKGGSAKLTLLVETEEWAVPVETALSVKCSYKAPGLKLSASSVQIAGENSDGVKLQLLSKDKKQTISDLGVTGVSAPEGYAVSDYNAEDGTFVIKAESGFQPGKISLEVTFNNTEETVSMPLTVKVVPVTLKLSPGSITLNGNTGDSAAVTVTATPADYKLTAPTIRLIGADKSDKLESGELKLSYENGRLSISTTDLTPDNAKYTLYISAEGGKVTALKISTTNAVPTLKLKAAGNLDLSFPEQKISLTTVFKNHSGGNIRAIDYAVTESSGKTVLNEDAKFFSLTKEGSDLFLGLRETEDINVKNTYTLNLSLTLADGSVLESSLKIPVKQTAVALKLSANKVILNNTIADKATVAVTCGTKGYDFTQPVWQLSDEGALDIDWINGKLVIAVNENTEFGSSYKLLVSAAEGAKATALTITIPAQNKSTITGSLKLTGTLDVVRDGTAITVAPIWKNCAEADRTGTLTVLNGNGEDVTACFNITEQNSNYLLSRAAGAKLDHSQKYKVILTADFGSGISAETSAALKLKMGSAKLTLNADSTTLFANDRHSRVNISFTSADSSLNKVARVEIKDAKLAQQFEVIDYGNGQYAIGFKNGTVPGKIASVSIPLEVWLEGNETTKANASLKVKLSIVR